MLAHCAEFRGMVGNQLPHGAKPGGKPQDAGSQAAAGAGGSGDGTAASQGQCQMLKNTE